MIKWNSTVALGRVDDATCRTCTGDRYEPHTSCDAPPCPQCVDTKCVYVCKTCSLQYMWPQFGPDCVPHYCCADHAARGADGMWRGAATVVWSAALEAAHAPLTVALPVWSCSPLEFTRAILSKTRVAAMLALDTPYKQWTDTMRDRVCVPPALVAANSPLVMDYVAVEQNATVADVIRHICDTLKMCRRDHSASLVIDHLPDPLTITIGQLLDGNATLNDHMDAEQCVLFTFNTDTGLASPCDATSHVWASLVHTNSGEQALPTIYIAHSSIISLTVPPPPQQQQQEEVPPHVAYGEKEPLSKKRGPVVRNEYADVNAWCIEHGAPPGGGHRTNYHVPVTRSYDALRCVGAAVPNFIVQLRGSQQHVHNVLRKRYPNVPCCFYNAARAHRSLLLVRCATDEERDRRMAQLSALLGPQIDKDASSKERARVREVPQSVLQLLDEWLREDETEPKRARIELSPPALDFAPL